MNNKFFTIENVLSSLKINLPENYTVRHDSFPKLVDITGIISFEDGDSLPLAGFTLYENVPFPTISGVMSLTPDANNDLIEDIKINHPLYVQKLNGIKKLYLLFLVLKDNYHIEDIHDFSIEFNLRFNSDMSLTEENIDIDFLLTNSSGSIFNIGNDMLDELEKNGIEHLLETTDIHDVASLVSMINT
tara:strand:+ start:395 stop:958 length:564 start_codon:yes stop_codon:yes gene_type:complete